MVWQLDGYNKFQLNVQNKFRPVLTMKPTTRIWIIEMDREQPWQNFGLLLGKFYSENDIFILLCQGFQRRILIIKQLQRFC